MQGSVLMGLDASKGQILQQEQKMLGTPRSTWWMLSMPRGFNMHWRTQRDLPIMKQRLLTPGNMNTEKKVFPKPDFSTWRQSRRKKGGFIPLNWAAPTPLLAFQSMSHCSWLCTYKKIKLRSEMASFVRLSCRSSRGGGNGSDALLWPQPRMAQHLAWVKFLVPHHGTEITLATSNTAGGDTQNQMCLLTLVKVSVLRRDVAEGISSAPGAWNNWSLLLEQYHPPRDDIPAVYALHTLWWDAIA